MAAQPVADLILRGRVVTHFGVRHFHAVFAGDGSDVVIPTVWRFNLLAFDNLIFAVTDDVRLRAATCQQQCGMPAEAKILQRDMSISSSGATDMSDSPAATRAGRSAIFRRALTMLFVAMRAGRPTPT